jgi:hypothetical protein
MKNSNNNIATMPQAAAAPTFTTANRHQLSRVNEINGEFFGLTSSSTVLTDLLELYGYMEESGLIQGADDTATSEIKRNYLFTIQDLAAYVAAMERNHFFFKSK